MSSRSPLRPLRAGLLAAAWLVLLAAPAPAAVLLQGNQQGSAANTDLLDTTAFTVGTGANQVMIIAVSSSGSPTVTRASFKGVPAQRFFSQDNSQPGAMCRTELWRIIDPPSGAGSVTVALSAMTSFGVGVLLYSGVDQKTPTEVITMLEGSSSSIRLTTSVPDNRPLVGVACLGGTWPMKPGPNAVSGSGDLTLWDFTERNVVGLGGQQAMAGSTTVSWNVSFTDPFHWAAVALTITPSGLASPLPDAGPDLARDAGPDLARDAGPDLARDARPDTRPDSDPPPPPPDAGAEFPAPPTPDAGDDAEVVDEDAGEIQPNPDAEAGGEGEDAEPAPPPADGAMPVPDELGGTTRNVNFEVGCACRLSGRARPGLIPALVLGLLALRRRRR
jgi:MYXO-CTERM domain-containing protein